jgi:dihydrofolate reductase
MTVCIVVAIAANRVIGARGRMPWRLPDDLARFRRLTVGHPVIMGRATYDSIGKPLARRNNIVLTRATGLAIEGCSVVGSREEALETAGTDGPVFVIGGASVYDLFMHLTQRMFVTWVDREVAGDTLFPVVDWAAWRITESSPTVHDVENRFPHRFVDYERSSP